MSKSRKSRPPLVAERRYGSQKAKPAAKRRSPTKKKAPQRKRRGLFGWIGYGIWRMVRLVWALFWRGAVAVLAFVALGVAYYAYQLPPAGDLIDGRVRGSVILLDRDGEEYAARGDQFRGAVGAESVSPSMHDAIVAVEDKRFYRHFGISPRGIASAIRINLRAGRGALSGNGGSTITQQTAKLLCVGREFDPNVWESEAAYERDCRETSLWRKAQEAVFALALETRYTKEEILTIYMNRAYFGSGARGVEAAAQTFFGVSARDVTPAQAAMIAGVLPSPSRLSPIVDLERSQARAATVIRLMQEQGYLTEAEAQEAWDSPATLGSRAEAQLGGWFAYWVVQEIPPFFGNETTEDVILTTTLDQDIQRAAEEALAHVFETQVREGSQAEAAIVVMSSDGAVRAMVGGRDGDGSGWNRAWQAVRQPGSAFKPFVFATALELGRSPNDMIMDGPICIDVPGPDDWCPVNYTREYAGPVSLTEALARSLNTPAVRLYMEVGRDPVQQVASGFGIESDLAIGPAVSLGVSELRLIELTGAYAGILNGGSAVEPYGIVDLRLRGDDEPLMAQVSGIRERIISERSARQLIYMMSQVMEVGTGQRARLDGRPSAGKSGTTQDAVDAWFVGFTADYVVGVWMGYDDNTPLEGVTGGGLPAEIWREVMERISVDLPVQPLPMEVPTDLGRQLPTGSPNEQDILRAVEGVLNETNGG